MKIITWNVAMGRKLHLQQKNIKSLISFDMVNLYSYNINKLHISDKTWKTNLSTCQVPFRPSPLVEIYLRENHGIFFKIGEGSASQLFKM